VEWAFLNYKTPDNSLSIAKAICNGTCQAISNGSFKDEMGMAAWILAMVNLICNYYCITQGEISIACNGLGPLTQCFERHQNPSLAAPQHDLIISI